MECRGWPQALAAARYAYVLAPPADDLVHSLKYEGWPELADLMGEAVAALDLPGPDSGGRRVVVPVPTTVRRLRRRGYNQAELLAARVARARGFPMVHALTRHGESESQTSLGPSARRQNVRGVFRSAAGSERAIRGADAVLVDDVLTTGATASEAADVLTAIGAASVALVTFARALPTAFGVRSQGLS